MLVFVFLPTLASLPSWFRYEMSNPLNFDDPMVTLFLPARFLRALLNAFSDGMNAGLLSGVLNGGIVSAWVWFRGAPEALRERLQLGAGAGAIASALMATTMLTINAASAGQLVLPFVPIAFEISSGIVCGLVAIPKMLRLLDPPGATRVVEARSRAAART